MGIWRLRLALRAMAREQRVHRAVRLPARRRALVRAAWDLVASRRANDLLRIRRMWTTLGAVTLVYAGTALWLDWRGQRPPPASRFDAIVVLGCRVAPGGVASPSLARRARHGARLYREGLAPTLVLTGGVGDHAPSEASVAAAIAQSEGVPPDALVLEERSTSTEENAREAARLLDARRVLVVTDAYHTYRAERVFARHFSEVTAVGSVGPTSTRVRGALREVTALGAYALAGRL